MKKERLQEILIIIASLLLAFLFSLSSAGKQIDLKLYDIFTAIKPKPQVWNRILYIPINDESLDVEGRWPWPRWKVAQGLETLKELGADRILFDIEFIDPSEQALNTENYAEILQYYGNQPLSALVDELIIEPDKVLARSMVEDGITNVYLPIRGVDESKKAWTDIDNDPYQRISYIAKKHLIKNKDQSLTNYLPVSKFLEIPVFPLFLGAKGMGNTEVNYDQDGVVRKVHLFQIYNDYLVPQLALPILFDELDIDKDKIEIVPGKYVKMVDHSNNSFTIPINISNEMLINWPGKWVDLPFGQPVPFHEILRYRRLQQAAQSYMAYAAENELTVEQQEIMEETIAALKDSYTSISNIQGKIVIIGLSAAAATDIGATALEPIVPLMITHGSLLNTIYQKAFLSTAKWYVNFIVILIMVSILFLSGIRIKAAFPEILISTGLLLTMFVVFAITLNSGIVLNYIFIITAAILSFIALIASKFILYDQQKNQIKSTFMQYLSPDVVQQLVDNPELATLGGERKEITAYFSDIQGFTSISEGMTPDMLVHLLNEYLTAMTDIILSHGGTVDKYEGDAIVAFFGAPIPHEDHAVRCCRAAVDMQKKLTELRAHWKTHDFPVILTRMGMNTGQAVVGNMGSQQRMDYTMMGDTVNLAARLEGANKAYGSYTMISGSTYEAVKDDFLTRKLDLLQVVGKSEPIGVYELIDRKGHSDQKTLDIIEGYNEALLEYEKRNWEAAQKKFARIASEFGDPPSQTYATRCAKFKKKAPPADWNGVYVLKSK